MDSGPLFYKEGLPTTIPKTEKQRGRSSSASSKNSSRPSLLLAFFSCLAWLYIAGRLWQDAENRTLLSNLLVKNSAQWHSVRYDSDHNYPELLSELLFDWVGLGLAQWARARLGHRSARPKVLTVEDKLMVLGCKDLERRIVEAEMEITLAKSQGFLENHLKQPGSSSSKKLLAVIGIYTGFGGRQNRNAFRGSWTPGGQFIICITFYTSYDVDSLKKLEERGIVIRFVIGRSPNRGDSLDRNIDEENRTTKDFLILDGHEEAAEESPKKAKFFFSAAVQNWDAEFYVKVDSNIHLDLEGLIELLESRRGQDSLYIGCMKSGVVVSEVGKQWYEPEWWKFGDEKSYFRHAAGSLIILSRNFANYININSASLKTYAHEDTSVGSWMMGIQATYIDDGRVCCSSSRQDKVCSLA
ncbi:hypothetical protein Ccrd_007733 [Cynara cardunculus var. scolymus]|uniref:Hexosyltransferase n=1 Tax=Cynara cardunculus var. scolymus TaxID=59895 RepID=A0A103XGI8_CYNCS|nr:hypothetical protein Ccrd_007733 [Cynara cardunculus var. scolymus]